MTGADEDEPRWYAIRVRQRTQFEIDQLLQSKGVESYAPSVIEMRRWSDRLRKVRVALFQGYSFVHIPWKKSEILTVLRTPGVISFVPGNETRAPLGTAEIEAVRKAADAVGCSRHHEFVPGRRVRVHGGCLDGLEGTLLRTGRGNRLVISVGQIQRSVSVPLQNCHLEAL